MNKMSIGLTGSIGTGKSTTAAMFAEFGFVVWDADAAVRELYAKGGAAVEPIATRFPSAHCEGSISRSALRMALEQKVTAFEDLERIVHPLVAEHRTTFTQFNRDRMRLYDIPLLFENSSETSMDAVVVTYVAEQEQKRRVLARGTMTEDMLSSILERQIPMAEKCARAKYVIPTNSLENARSTVRRIVLDLD